MKIIDILNLGGTHAGDALKEELETIKAEVPQLAPACDRALAALDTDLSPQAVLDLLAALPPEVANILKLKLDPHKHAGDAN